ncbi:MULTISPECIES: DNA methyltransferase [Gordonia]|uniref:DNA methyltransferase n=1 Tax=Gordonia TaxID=2053 RepID=UPI00257B1AAE|nr:MULTISPECIES: DNA methyltransferase [Gordonia]
MTDYADFLTAKVDFDRNFGFDIDLDDVHPTLFPHQRLIVQWAVKGGRRAIFAAFGLGKTFMQLETLHQCITREGGRALIVCPLGVRGEFARDAAKLGYDTAFIRRDAEVAGPGIYITNYESVRDGKLHPAQFTAVSLDEASILRSFGSKTYQTFLPMFADVRFRFVATATPSPNRYKELIHYAGYLGVMDTGQALAQPLSEPVLTPAGWSTMGDLRPGDQVIGVDGKPTDILGVYPQGEKPIYRVEFSDGTYTRTTGDHLWLTRTQYERNAATKFIKRNPGTTGRLYWSTKTTDEIAQSLVCTSTGAKNHQVPIADPVMFDARTVDLDPYLLGFLLGDGHLRQTSVNFTTADEWIVDHLAATVADLGLGVRKNPHVRADGQPNYDYAISAGAAGRTGRGHESNAVLRAVRRYGMIGKRAWEKFVPDDYLYNTPDVRLALLQGLMDADGTISNDPRNRTTRLCTTSRHLADDTLFIARSLGGTATVAERVGRKPNGDPGRIQFIVTLRLPSGTVPFRLPRKADLVRDRGKYPPRRYITAVIPDGTELAQCIAVDHPDHLYVTRDCLVTHNTRFFQRDSTKANNLTLYPHKEREFWLWLNTWSIFVQSPADIGCDATGYDLPGVDMEWHEVDADHTDVKFDRDGAAPLFKGTAMSLVDASREKRETIAARVAKLARLVATHDSVTGGDQIILWCDLNAEQAAIEAAMDRMGFSYSSVYGSLDPDETERRLQAWRDRKTKCLIGKPVMLGQGMNLQQCNTAVYVGITHKFNDFIQSQHRIVRFGQTRRCRIHVIYADSEREVKASLLEKWAQHKELTNNMTKVINEHGLSQTSIRDALKRSIGVTRSEASGDGWLLANNDCVPETQGMEANSIDLVVTSIPFSNHYEYTPAVEDFGHTDDNQHFWQQMDYLTPELLRILKPGRVYACHVKDRILFGNVTGAGVPTVSPFHAEAIFHAQRHGFDYMGMITVVTDVVRENNQTYRLGWSEQCKDATKMGVGSPEYILLFHKPQTNREKGYADTPVVKSKDTYTRARWQVDAHAFWRSSGDRLLTTDELAALPPEQLSKLFTDQTLRQVYDYESHVRIGEELDGRGSLPATFMSLAPASWRDDVWHDVNRMLTLNGEQKRRNVQMHVCPLQIDIVDRLINRFSNPDELVFDPFSGLGTVPLRALKAGRRGRGVELNAGYWLDSVKYLEAEERRNDMPTLFDFEAGA